MTIQNKGLSRRSFLKTGTAVGAAALASPALVSKAFASSGELNILMWSDYLPDSFLAEFKAETGISVNFTGIGSNEELINKMKAANGSGADIISPTNNRSLQWGPLELLQPVDMNRVDIDKVNPAMAKIGPDAWNFGGGRALGSALRHFFSSRFVFLSSFENFSLLTEA